LLEKPEINAVSLKDENETLAEPKISRIYRSKDIENQQIEPSFSAM